ncbi:hypothetical protein LP420_15440 [Massilia sp. B-10]|nr:hypothetical protein LP420_15440 [Massilia sp. B-10]
MGDVILLIPPRSKGAVHVPLPHHPAVPAAVARIAGQRRRYRAQCSRLRDYDTRLAPLFDYLHRNPELSFMEVKTAARMAKELREAGFEVTEGVGKTGVVAILKERRQP